jgi:hypothetical protein
MGKRKAGDVAASLMVAQRIERSIHLVRGQKVMLSNDLARLYGESGKRVQEPLALRD